MHGRTIIKEMLQHDFYVYYIGSQQTDAVATSSPRKTKPWNWSGTGWSVNSPHSRRGCLRTTSLELWKKTVFQCVSSEKPDNFRRPRCDISWGAERLECE